MEDKKENAGGESSGMPVPSVPCIILNGKEDSHLLSRSPVLLSRALKGSSQNVRGCGGAAGRLPSLESFGIEISDGSAEAEDMELHIAVASNHTPRMRVLACRAAPILCLSVEQEMALLGFMLHECLGEELRAFRLRPSLSYKRECRLPFVEFCLRNLIHQFPLWRDLPQSFWEEADGVVTSLNGRMHGAAGYRRNLRPPVRLETECRLWCGTSDDLTALKTIWDGLENSLVLFFQHVLRSPLSAGQVALKEEEGRQRARMFRAKKWTGRAHEGMAGKEEEEEGDGGSGGGGGGDGVTEDGCFLLQVDVVATRSVCASGSSKAYTVYIVEASYGNRRGLMGHRYSNFEILHRTLLANFQHVRLPALPAKKRFRQQTAEFVEIRRRELRNYLHQLSLIDELKQCGELHGFLLAGCVDTLTAEEQQLVDERRKVQFDAEEGRQKLATYAGRLLQDSAGIEQIHSLMDHVQKAEEMEELPEVWRKLLTAATEAAAHFIYGRYHEDLRCEEHMSLCSKLYSALPFTMLRFIVAKADKSSDVVDTLLALLLARPPLTSKSVVQKLIKEYYERHVAALQDAFKDRRHVVPHQDLLAKITHFCEKQKPRVPREGDPAKLLRAILLDRSVEPVLSRRLVDYSLADAGIVRALVQFLDLELHKHDMRAAVGTLAEDSSVAGLRSVLRTLLEPIIGLLDLPQLSVLVSLLEDALSDILDIAKRRLSSPSASLAEYRTVLTKVMGVLYRLLHKSVRGGESCRVRMVWQWVAKMLELARCDDVGKHFTVNVQELFVDLAEEDLTRVREEIKDLEYQRRVQELLVGRRRVVGRLSVEEKESDAKLSQSAEAVVFFPRRASISLVNSPPKNATLDPPASSSSSLSVGATGMKELRERLTFSDDEVEAGVGEEEQQHLYCAPEEPTIVVLPRLKPTFLRLVQEALFASYRYHASMGSPKALGVDANLCK